MLVLGGLAVGLMPGIPMLQIAPEVILLIFLPAVLFEEASRLTRYDLRTNVFFIGFLAFALVVVTCAAVAAVCTWLFPGIPLPVAIVIGAIVAPADSISSEAILARLKVSRRIINTLTGEGLVNDTISVVIYKLAVASVLSSAVSLPPTALEFVFSIAGGVVFGISTGWVGVRLLRISGEHMTYSLLSILLAFTTYFAAERLGASAPVATVAAGVQYALRTPTTVSAELRFNAGVAWEVVIFALNALGFVLIGVQLPTILVDLKYYSAWQLTLDASAVVGTVVAVRFMLVTGLAAAEKLIRWRRRSVGLSWRDDIVIAWGGMRGLVSLASALALPLTPEGSVFPYRDLALFLAFVVILFTLVAQGLSLASIVRLLRVGNNEAREEIRRARLEAAEAALRVLDLLAAEATVSGAELGVLRDEYNHRIGELGDEMRTASPTAGRRSLEYIRLKLIDAERQQLLSISRRRDIGDAILRQLLSELDVAEIAVRNRSKQQGPSG